MSHVRGAKLFGVGLTVAAVCLPACAGPEPDRPSSERPASPPPGPPPFGRLDLNGDGRLTLEEFERHQIPHGGHGEVFSTIDTNSDRIITQSEFENHEPPAPPMGR